MSLNDVDVDVINNNEPVNESQHSSKNVELENLIKSENDKHKKNKAKKQSKKKDNSMTMEIKSLKVALDEEVHINIKQPKIWAGFPCIKRLIFALFCNSKCLTDTKSNVPYTSQCLNHTFEVDSALKLTDKILEITVLRSGTLDIQDEIRHPFVRVSIINLKTGKLLQKSSFETQVFTKTESLKVFEKDEELNRMQCRESKNIDFIYPFATAPFDIRGTGEPYAQWDEVFHINDKAENILTSTNVIFFELLDFNLLSKGKTETCIEPIAWAYLKPVGFSKMTYLGKHKLQLYKFSFTQSSQYQKDKLTEMEYSKTPDVVYELDWINKVKYQTYLQVNLSLIDKPNEDDMKMKKYQDYFYKSIYYDESDEKNFELLRRLRKGEKTAKKRGKEKKDDSLDYIRRYPFEKCEIPNQLLYKFETEKLGCLTHEFSRNGRYIAAACTKETSETLIKIFNVETGQLKYIFKGHQNLIHHILWSFDDLLLFTCSSDYNLSIWRVPFEDNNNEDNTNYLKNQSQFLVATIPHPGYVYCCDLFPDKANKEQMYLATACFDGVVRVYSLAADYDENSRKYVEVNYELAEQKRINEEKEDIQSIEAMKTKYLIHLAEESGLPKKEKKELESLSKTVLFHMHPNCLIFGETGQLYIGDSLGFIHIWEFMKTSKSLICKRPQFSHKDIGNVSINKISFIPTIFSDDAIGKNQTNRILVHTRDNFIRLLDISSNKPRLVVTYSGANCNKTNIKSTVSPDGSYLMSGSEAGEPVIWIVESANLVGVRKLQASFVYILNDVSWNNCYHMTGISAFGQEYPLLIHAYVRKKKRRKKKINKLNLNKNKGDSDDEILVDSEDENVDNHILDNKLTLATEYKGMIEEDVVKK